MRFCQKQKKSLQAVHCSPALSIKSVHKYFQEHIFRAQAAVYMCRNPNTSPEKVMRNSPVIAAKQNHKWQPTDTHSFTGGGKMLQEWKHPPEKIQAAAEHTVGMTPMC